jgi:hypothetical protein
MGLAARAALAGAPLPTYTPETRRAAAEAFLVVVPVDEEVTRLIDEIGSQVPEDRLTIRRPPRLPRSLSVRPSGEWRAPRGA